MKGKADEMDGKALAGNVIKEQNLPIEIGLNLMLFNTIHHDI
jgi:hypothetical protein